MIKRTNQKGFSMLEMIVVMSIFLVIVSASYEFISRGFTANIFGSEEDDAVRNARLAANVIVKEIREAKSSAAGDYLFNTVSTSTLIFYGDTDNDGYSEKIRYFLDGRILKRGITKAAGSPLQYSGTETVTSLVNYINNFSTQPIFTYYDTNNSLISDPTNNKNSIRLVHVSLKINVTPYRAPNDYYLESDIQVRNLKDNL